LHIAIAVAKKVAGSALEDAPIAEIERVIRESFVRLSDTPRIVIYLHPELLALSTQRVEQLTRTHGFEGEIDLRPDALQVKGDCRIEWEGGGLKSSKEDIWQQIEQIYHEIVS
jgi:flagellar assembly protein FliH